MGEGLGEGLQGAGLSRLLALLLLWQESLAVACESLRRMRADMGSTNILSPLRWVVRQPIPRGHPRLLFLLTAGAVGDTGKVLEVLRNHSSSTRYGGAGRQEGKKPGTSRVGCSSSAGGRGAPWHRHPRVRNRGRIAGCCCQPREKPQRVWNGSQKFRCFLNNQKRDNWADNFTGSRRMLPARRD